uniref:UDP-glucuronosyltransferase n=1 Tax=Ditylenchus dipsaci TaxID=166011 RepID=A0A915CLS6_9BILA
MFGIFHKIGVKTKVSSYAITFVNLIGSNFGIPHFSSYITNMWAPSLNGPKMNFFERAYNFYTDLYENYKIRPLINQLEQPLFNSAFGDDFPLVCWGIVEIDKKSLEQKFHKIFDRSKSGVILFSFGTFINASKMTHEMRNHFLSSFAEFPNYEFIWKFDEPQKDLPPNVHVFNWINQRTILAHPETKAFITHCGVNSINEAALNGVPVLCIPLLGDQYYNGAVVRHNELGVYLDILKLDKNSMNRSLKEVLDNPQYREKAQVLKQKLRLQPFSAKERLVKWVEFAAEFSELNELNLPCIDEMGVFVYYSLDVIAVALVFSPSIGWSHMQLQGAVADALVEAGHQVHILTMNMNPLNGDYKSSKLAHRVTKVDRKDASKAEFSKIDIVQNPFAGYKNMMFDGAMKTFNKLFVTSVKNC